MGQGDGQSAHLGVLEGLDVVGLFVLDVGGRLGGGGGDGGSGGVGPGGRSRLAAVEAWKE